MKSPQETTTTDDVTEPGIATSLIFWVLTAGLSMLTISVMCLVLAWGLTAALTAGTSNPPGLFVEALIALAPVAATIFAIRRINGRLSNPKLILITCGRLLACALCALLALGLLSTGF